ncbi:glutamate--cysteine ligase [Nocardioides dubius]
MGVEEELLVVDHQSGRPLGVAGKVIARGDHDLTTEFKRQQLETDSPPRSSLDVLAADLRASRDVAIAAARAEGARVVASGTAPTETTSQVVPEDRYRAMVERYGITATEQLTCGCHVHVAVDSDDEGAVALNGIRIWLPVLLALSANSPFWQGHDTRFASFRAQAMARWPSSGPPDLFADGADYRATVQRMVETGVLMDVAMVYFDARLSARYPTIEIRVADVCPDVRDTVLLAALCRALVDTVVAERRPPPDIATSWIRLATWQASRHGLEGTLLDPHTLRPTPAHDVVQRLVDLVTPALAANGDLEFARDQVARILQDGNGASQQRAVLARTNRLSEVVAQLARVTAGHAD